jgi:predicted nucleic acid-binding protein
VIACENWMASLLARGERMIVPEIADYEIRRELLRANKTAGIARLDHFCAFLEYLPITTVAMRRAAEFWAEARQQGFSTAGDKAIDADVILAAQAVSMYVPEVIIATGNVGHMSRFVPADLWSNII